MTPPLARWLSVAASLAAAGRRHPHRHPVGRRRPMWQQHPRNSHQRRYARADPMGARVSLISPERVIITNDAGTNILRDVPAGKYTGVRVGDR